MNRTQNVVNLRLEVYFLSNCTPLNLYVCSPRSNRWHCCLKSLHHYVPSIKPLVSANKPSLTTMSLKVQTLKIVPEALLSLFTLSCKEIKQTACGQSKVAVKCSFTFQSVFSVQYLCTVMLPFFQFQPWGHTLFTSACSESKPWTLTLHSQFFISSLFSEQEPWMVSLVAAQASHSQNHGQLQFLYQFH